MEVFGIKKKVILSFIILSVASIGMVLWQRWEVIFQRGNPIPYLVALTKLSEERAYVMVDDGENTYISQKGECTQLFEDFQKINNVEFVEQAGSGYIFTNGTDNFVISSEVYWGKYTVWLLPANVLQIEN